MGGYFEPLRVGGSVEVNKSRGIILQYFANSAYSHVLVQQNQSQFDSIRIQRVSTASLEPVSEILWRVEEGSVGDGL